MPDLPCEPAGMEFSFNGSPIIPYFLLCFFSYLVVLSAIAFVKSLGAKRRRGFFGKVFLISLRNSFFATVLFLALFFALAIFPPIFPESVTSVLGGLIYFVSAFLLGVVASAIVPFLVFLGLGISQVLRAE